MKHFTPLAAFVLLGACCTPGHSMPDSPETTATPSICNFAVRDISAWRNRMPGPEGAGGNLVVVIEIEADEISRRFQSQGVSEDGTLMLDVVEWDHPSGIGKIVYRSKGVAADSVEIRCGGELLTRIGEVMDVY